MISENISINAIITRNVNIINRVPISSGETLNVELKSKINAKEEGFSCLCTVIIYRETESEVSDKSFCISQVIEGDFSYLNEETSLDSDMTKEWAITIMYPFIRAQIASVTGAIGMDSIIIPTFIAGR